MQQISAINQIAECFPQFYERHSRSPQARISGTKQSFQESVAPMIRLPPQLPQDQGKLTVVLDVDETILHTELVSINGIPVKQVFKGAFVPDLSGSQHFDKENSFSLTIRGLTVRAQKRPFLDSFLREAAKRFELVAFTAGAEDYAKPLLDHLDPTGTIFRHRLFRQHCTSWNGSSFVKDLRILNRPLNRTVLVDNNAHSFFMQLENGIPIASFFDDDTDKALITLFTFLESLEQVDDVRHVLAQVFGLEAAFGGLAHSATQNTIPGRPMMMQPC